MTTFKWYSHISLCVTAMTYLLLSSGSLLAEVHPEALIVAADHEGVQRVTMVLESYSYSPSDLIVAVGKPVEFILKNESFLVPHSFLLDSPDGKRLIEVSVDSGEVETARVTLTLPGIYPFYCDKQLLFFPDHREEGMEGRLTVR